MLCTVKFLQNKRWKNMKEPRNYWRLCQCWCVQLKQSITVFAVTCWRDNNYKILIFHNVYSQNMLTSSFVDCSDTSVTSSLSETKGFFCFWFNKPLEKCLFSHTEYHKKEANVKGKKTCRTLFNTPKQNYMRNLERFRQSSLLSKIPNSLSLPKPSILVLRINTL